MKLFLGLYIIQLLKSRLMSGAKYILGQSVGYFVRFYGAIFAYNFTFEYS